MNPVDNIRPNLVGDHPKVHPTALIDPSAQIIGNVVIGKNVFVAPLAVIRADERGPDGVVEPIVIGEEVNIQDGVIIHSHGGTRVTIGARTAVGHGATIHGPCTIGEECFLAIRCTIYSATLESNVWVGPAAMVMRTTIDTYSYIQGGSVIRSSTDAKNLRLISEKEQEYMRTVWEATRKLREGYVKRQSRTGAVPRENEKAGEDPA